MLDERESGVHNRFIVAACVVVALLLTGCGGDDDQSVGAAASIRPEDLFSPDIPMVADGQTAGVEWQLLSGEGKAGGRCVQVRTDPTLPPQGLEGLHADVPGGVREEESSDLIEVPRNGSTVCGKPTASPVEIFGGDNSTKGFPHYIFGMTTDDVSSLEAVLSDGRSETVQVYQRSFVFIYPDGTAVSEVRAFDEHQELVQKCKRVDHADSDPLRVHRYICDPLIVS